MKLKNLTILLVLALLIGLLFVPRPVAQETMSSAFSAIPLRQQVAADLKAQGKPSPELRLPKAANNGRPFNPQDATPVGLPRRLAS